MSAGVATPNVASQPRAVTKGDKQSFKSELTAPTHQLSVAPMIIKTMGVGVAAQFETLVTSLNIHQKLHEGAVLLARPKIYQTSCNLPKVKTCKKLLPFSYLYVLHISYRSLDGKKLLIFL